jgi:glutaminyl-peptide cyclotransferase
MHGAKTLLIVLAALPLHAADFSGARALEATRQAVALGPRPSGSAAIRKLQFLIHQQLKNCGCEVRDDDFTATTPKGPVAMKNIIARFPGTSGRMIAITGHYDTKLFPGRNFVGANDGGASGGFLIEMARALAGRMHKNEVDLVWLDGEEAVEQWSDTDGTYGSRHLAAKWSKDGTLAKIRALINVDMIGDRDLGILQEQNSSQSLLRLSWAIARETGYGKYFLESANNIEDDHIPFLRAGVNALDLIDFDYGPDNSWWHTDADTMDKLSAHSLEVTGSVVLELIARLERGK